MTHLPLFDDPPQAAALAGKLRALAGRGVYIGGSSWKYPGWLGRIYTPQRYFTRGKFSKAKFEAECLAEYAETFPIVCGDFTFYQFPSPDAWRKLFLSAPNTLLYAFKAPEEITAPAWPLQPRYGARGGMPNEHYLNAALFMDQFLGPLEPYRQQVAAIVFEFGPGTHLAYNEGEDFAADLARFLDKLPRGWRYSVEIRNPEWLAPFYFDCLRKRGAAHVYSSWTRMPEMAAQLRLPGSATADFTVARALLKPGRTYEEAVKKLAPYEEVRDVYAAGRAGLKAVIETSLYTRHTAYVFVNNRFEGNSPQTIEAVVDGLATAEPVT